MSATTRCSAGSRAAAAAATLLLSIAAHASALRAPALPDAASALIGTPVLVGGGEFRAFGFHVYDGWLWSPSPSVSSDGPIALDIVYRRPLTAEAIAQRSVDEIARLGFGSDHERGRWGERLRTLLPDIARGDRLTGVHVPGRGARFFHNGRPIGDIDDAAFARAFFAIWLDPRTSRPDFRARLLGAR